MTPRAIEPAPPPTACMPWHARNCHGGGRPDRGGECRWCKREIAIPDDTPPRSTTVCIYCAMDRGVIPAIEIPFSPAEERLIAQGYHREALEAMYGDSGPERTCPQDDGQVD